MQGFGGENEGKGLLEVMVVDGSIILKRKSKKSVGRRGLD
jgi:hypothetical protein